MSASPFHPGEQLVQARVGVRERMDARGARAIRDAMPDEHRAFFALLTFLPIATESPAGWPIASILTGPAGFVSSPDPRSLHVAAGGVRVGERIGILGIDLATRRRNRVNGRVAAADVDGFTVAVEQSFGNCAQYIQTREAMPVPRGPLRTESLSGLDTRARDAIDAADTLFVASASAAGLDMSHRGGRPGFVRQDGEVLTIPDFSGNRYFNTLGNFALNPRAALLIPDFASGDVLHLSGTVEIVWDGEEVRQFAGAERLWRFTLRAAERRISALPPRWSDPAYSPSLAGTGIWREGATQTGIRAPSAPPSLSTPVVSP